MASVLEGLNEAQHTAVTSPSDVLQILAPPGSGKTKTLTSRVAYLLQYHHYKPWNVICLTFTIKSSREMKERIARLLGNGVESRLILGTFHSVCRRYLVTYGHLIGLMKGFGIADSSDTIGIIKRITKRLGVTIDPRKAQSRISGSKSRGISHSELAQEKTKEKLIEQQEFSMVFEAYEDHLARSNLLDYDDLLLRCVELLRLHPSCISNVEVVLIDEFQDTNIVQFDLMRLFATKNKRVTTVGDPDQSIYGWRSAEIKNLRRMQTQYPDTLVIHLKDNYRSSGAILLAAHEVIEQDESRPSKPLLPTHCPGTTPVLRRLPSSEVEAFWVVSEIQRNIALTGNVLDFSDFAVLLRSASLSRHIESAMGKAGVPYRMVGGHRFFDRVEVKILLDYLRVISQPHNNDALSRIINAPTRGVGSNTAKGLLEDAEAKKKSLWTLIKDAVQGHKTFSTKVSKPAENGLGSLISIILTSRNKILDPTTPHSPEDLLQYIIKRLDFQPYLEKTHSEDHEARWANVEELVAQASEYPVLNGEENTKEEEALPQIEGVEQEEANSGEEALSKFLANVALATELQREDEDPEDRPQSQVTISTIHAAKGLEWPVVFVPSAYEGIIPHSRAEDTDEERRLLYVAMTRAQALLYISCPKKNSQREEATLSPFLSTKKVARFLVNKGPEIHSASVNDICRILGRDFPTQGQVNEACKTLESRNDDLWPLNGEEDSKAVGARWSKWDNFNCHDHAAKRRRLEAGDAYLRNDNSDAINSAGSFMLSKMGASTTMQNSSTFSCTGFVSATSQLHQTDSQKKIKDIKAAIPKSESMTNGKTTSTQVRQGSLMSFWGKGDRVENMRQQPMAMKPIADDIRLESVAGHSHSKRSSGHDLAEPVVAASKQASLGNQEQVQRIPLGSIPQSLSTHRLPLVSNTSRPYLATAEDEPVRNQYIFLSSSPPPPSDKILEEAEEMCDQPSYSGIASSLEKSEATPVLCDMKPSKTLHTTSVSQLRTGPILPKRTLGVRRSMNGWSARTNQGFSVPKLGAHKPKR